MKTWFFNNYALRILAILSITIPCRYKGDEPLSEGGRIKLVSAGGGKYSLVLSNIEAGDGGKFSARAANEFGESRCTATLLVRGTRTILSLTPQ